MIYDLNDLLKKMGVSEVSEKGRVVWHYFDKQKKTVAGFADIRLEAGGEILCAELQQIRENYEDDSGKIHPTFVESFFFYAERTGNPSKYEVTRMTLDGADYQHPSKAIVELGLSVFHARALEISIRTVEQAFNKEDILETTITASPQSKRIIAQRKEFPRMPQHAVHPEQQMGVVVPFRPRNIGVRAATHRM